MLSHANLTRLARLHLEHDFSRDLVQEYLDSLLGVEAFEPLEASKDEGITDSVTAKTPKSRSRQSKKAKSQTAPPSEKSRPSEQSKPSSTRRRQGPKPPRQLKHDAPGGHTVGVGLKETDPTSETTNSRKLTLPPAAQCGEDVAKRVAKMVPESRAKQITEQSGAVEHKAQELALGDTEPTQIRNKGRNGRRMKQSPPLHSYTLVQHPRHMSGISTRIDKGQTRFAPKLKARPNRSKTVPSEDGTPAPTPSLSGSDAGSFGASLLESDAGPSSAAASTTAGASTTAEKELSSKRLSTVSSPAAAPMSPPSTFTRPIPTPKSPPFSPTKTQKDKPAQQGTAISFPTTSDKPAVEESHSASTTAGKPIVVGSSKPAKGASIISVPTARTHTQRDDEDEEETPESLTSSRKRSKGKQVVRNRTRESSHMEEGEDLTEDGDDDEVPDYSDTYMHEFTKDMGIGRRSKIYFELLKLEEEKRKLKRQRRKERARQRANGGKGHGDREVSQAPGPVEDVVDEPAEEYAEQVAIKQDEKEAEAKREPSVPAPQLKNKTLAPQLRVVDGRIELDEDSLVVDHAVVDAVEDQGPMEYVEESTLTKFVNSSSYSTKPKSEKWSEEDTDRFYEAISQWGTDFGIIFQLFPGKSRIGVRNKFKREDRINHQRIEEALNRRAGMDLKEYSEVTNKTYPEVDEAAIFKKQPEDEEDLLPDLSFADEYRDDGEELEGVEKEEEPQEEEETEEILGTIDG
ncbi:hypothetical protein KVV02_008719 [Mortierella alpina]|uniref:Myb-like domain-containing protein n=1 Tax=Mortierella alpina TaxID=64518 RepID=A0A9P8ACQ8_MORAP|nr:hypothetical protein KVV02_008719 [Mortierella alpina]